MRRETKIMNELAKIVAELDAKIAGLQHARETLVALSEDPESVGADKPRRGHPRGISKSVKPITPSKAAKSKRTLSPEARARIAEGQKLRWAKHRNKAPKAAAQK